MAEVTLVLYDAVRAGLDLTASKTVVVTANTYYFFNNGSTVLHVANASGSTLTVTITTPNTVDGLAIADKTGTLDTAKSGIFGPFPPSIYNDANEMVKVTFNQIVDIVAIRL